MKKTVLIIAGVVLLFALVVYLTSDDQVEVPQPTEVQPSTAIDMPQAGDEAALPETSWVWVETVAAEGESITPNEPGSFVLSFIDEERFGAQTDCNNVAGSYMHYAGELTFEEMLMTEMTCMNMTQEAEFIEMLSQVETVSTDQDGRLILGFGGSTGYMAFTFIEG